MDGVVKWFHGKKGYGFIIGEDAKDYFVSFTDIDSSVGYKMLNEGNKVFFEVSKQNRQEFKYDKALRVKVIDETTKEEKNGKQS